MKLLTIRMTDFKGIRGTKEIKLSEKETLISGYNGSGKTTIFDAHLWLWTDKDSSLKSNPKIRPDDERECVPTVEEEWDISGIRLVIAKMQKKKTGKPDTNGISKVSLTNTYSINGVPKTERDFKKDLTERGFDFDKFLFLSHSEVFTRQKSDDMRKILFSMATSKTDLKVALMTEGCKDVAKLLEAYRIDEIIAMNKASKKKAEEQLAAIPNQIIGLEKAKVDINIKPLVIRRDEIKREILELDITLSNSKDSELTILKLDELTKEFHKFKIQKERIEQEAQKCLNEKRGEINSKLILQDKKESELKSDLRIAEINLNAIEREINLCNKELKKAQEDYIMYSELEYDETNLHEIESEEFDENSLFCPTCGQLYPEDMQLKRREAFEQSKKKRIEKELSLKKSFEKDRDKSLEEITENGNIASGNLKNAKSRKSQTEQKIIDTKKQISMVSDEMERLNQELETVPKSVDLSNDDGYQEICGKIEKLKEEWQERTDVSNFCTKKQQERDEKQKELEMIISEISKADNNTRIDKQISELEEKRQDYAQAKADSEKILYQISLLEKAKNEILSEDINNNFNIVKWKLFDFLKNGEYRECCIPLVQDKNGEWRQIGASANTALETQGKLDIIRGLQNFYGFYPPVFVDYASELDEKSMGKIKMDCQTIFLKVDNSEFNVKEI